MTAYLLDVKSVVPDFHQTYNLIGHNVEDEDVKGVIARVNKKTFQTTLVSVDPHTDVISHQETKQSGQRQR